MGKEQYEASGKQKKKDLPSTAESLGILEERVESLEARIEFLKKEIRELKEEE